MASWCSLNTKINLSNDSQSNLPACLNTYIYFEIYWSPRIYKELVSSPDLKCIERKKIRLNYQVRFTLHCTVSSTIISILSYI